MGKSFLCNCRFLKFFFSFFPMKIHIQGSACKIHNDDKIQAQYIIPSQRSWEKCSINVAANLICSTFRNISLKKLSKEINTNVSKDRMFCEC
uniref:Uncharacterized protein n=1 Tax=Parascaris univalens TaxID=6257 RepID=A0A915C0E0_PARUN